MNNEVAARIKQVGWGSKSAVLAEHLVHLIQKRIWRPGDKLPSTRTIAADYDVSMETVRSALHELQGRGLIRMRARSGGVVCEPGPRRDDAPAAPRSIAYIRLLESAAPGAPIPVGGDETLAGLERGFLAEDLQMTLVSQRPEGDRRAEALVERLRQMQATLAGAILLRPPSDVRAAACQWLDSANLPWLIVGRCSGHDQANMMYPDYLGMGQMIGRYLAAVGARQVWFLTLPLGPAENHSGVEKMEGLVGGYLQAGAPSPVITPILCRDVDGQTAYVQTRQKLAGGARPDAIVGYGDRMAMGAIRACREAGLRVPQDVAVLGTTGTRHAACFDPPLSVGDQQLSLLTESAVGKLTQMMASGERRVARTVTPVRLILRQSTQLNDAVRTALADDLEQGRATVDQE
jgi:LacI family transcriptional regulator